MKSTSALPIEGHWIDDVLVNGKKYWDIEFEVRSPLTEIAEHLCSDSSERQDLKAFREADLKVADVLC